MAVWAQTNLQLLNQLNDLNWSETDIRDARNAYQLAIVLFAGQFRPSGSPFIHHLVRTASILADMEAEPNLVKAGLLHAAYEQGDFGYSRWGPTRRKRSELRDAVGEDIETLVYRYAKFYWIEYKDDISTYISQMGDRDGDILFMRLANELEEYLDLGVLYATKVLEPAEAVRQLQRHENLAEATGHPRLAQAFARVAQDYDEGRAAALTLPLAAESLRTARAIHYAGRDSSFRLVPRSTQMRPTLALRHRLGQYPWFKRLTKPIRAALHRRV